MKKLKLTRRKFILSLLSTVALGLPETRSARASLTPVKPFSFAFVTDIHLTNSKPDSHILYHESQIFLQEAVKNINQLDVDFVIFGGDQVETPGKSDENWNLFIDVVQNLNCPWNFILGDRDIGGIKIVDKMRTFGVDWKGKGIDNPFPWWSTNPAPNVHLVGLDTSKNGSKKGFVPQEQLVWLKDDLARNFSKFTIVFSHHPIFSPPPFDGASPWSNYALEEAGAVKEVLAGSPYVKLCLSGHVLVNKLSREGGIYFVSSSGLTSYPCTFKVFRVNPDDIFMETYQIGFKSLVQKSEDALKQSNLAYYYDKSKPKQYLKVAEGSKVDWDAELPLGGGMTPSFHKKKKKKKRRKGRNKKRPSRK